MKQPCYQACARKTDKVTFATRSDPIVFAIVFNAKSAKDAKILTTKYTKREDDSRVERVE